MDRYIVTYVMEARSSIELEAGSLKEASDQVAKMKDEGTIPQVKTENCGYPPVWDSEFISKGVSITPKEEAPEQETVDETTG